MVKGLLFGRTFCNFFGRLALTILREWRGAWGWSKVREWYADKPKLNGRNNSFEGKAKDSTQGRKGAKTQGVERKCGGQDVSCPYETGEV